MNKFLTISVWLVLGLAFGLILLFSYWMLYPYKPIVFKNVPYGVENKIVKIGEPLRYEVVYCKFMNINPNVSRYFVNGLIYQITASPAVIKPIGCGRTNVQIEVPPSLTPDTYYLKILYIYQVNPIRQVSIEAITEEFEVTK